MSETAEYVRAYKAGHRSAHLVPPGAREALCGASPREGRSWLGTESRHAARLASLPACRFCGAQAALAAELAAIGAGLGVTARIPWRGYMAQAGECVRCDRFRVLPIRGLCTTCYKYVREDGSLGDYGWTRNDRLAEYAGLRAGGLSIPAAAKRMGVSTRTGTRYEAELREAGNAPWRAAA